MKAQTSNKLALIIAAVAMLGTVGNTCFTWWSHLQRERVLFDVTCEPALNEPAYFRQIFTDDEMLTFFAKCLVTNISSKKVYITRVHAGSSYSGVDVEGSRIYGSTPSSKFTPDDTETIYQYDEGTKNLKPFTLPIAVDGGEQVVFFTKMELVITKKMIEKFNTNCPDRLKRKITLMEVFEGCMNGHVTFGYPHPYTNLHINPKDILYEITPFVRISTTCPAGRLGFLGFDAKTPTIYIIKRD